MIVQVTVFLAPVVKNVDSAIHRINLNPVDKYLGNLLHLIHLLNNWGLNRTVVGSD